MRPILIALTAALAAILAAGPLSAAERLSPEEFRDWSEGSTVYFEQNGRIFGAEEFREGGRTTWRFSDGTCVEGAWVGQEDSICFLYENMAEPLCWGFFRDEEGYYAEPDDAPEDRIRATGRDDKRLTCSGPTFDL